MGTLWPFIAGNMLDAVLSSAVGLLFLLCIGSVLASWLSFRDETQYEQRRRKTDLDGAAIDMLFGMQADGLEPLRKDIQEKATNLVLLKHSAIRQAIRYARKALIYALFFVFALCIQTWHMNQEMQSHEAEPSVVASVMDKDGGESEHIRAVRHENGFVTVSVSEPNNSSTYEFVYNEQGEKIFEQKVLCVPSAIQNTLVAVWILTMIGARYIFSIN